MMRVTCWFLVVLTYCWLGASLRSEDVRAKTVPDQPIAIDDLKSEIDGKEVTVRFTITGLDGIAGSAKEGQAPSFVIETAGGKTNVFSVWIEGELANVLDRLQLSFCQENPLKAGTMIVATGKLRVHTMDRNLYTLSVRKWKHFRILPAKAEE